MGIHTEERWEGVSGGSAVEVQDLWEGMCRRTRLVHQQVSEGGENIRLLLAGVLSWPCGESCEWAPALHFEAMRNLWQAIQDCGDGKDAGGMSGMQGSEEHHGGHWNVGGETSVLFASL